MISILICTYKRPLLLKKCIESVINQITTHEYEVIVCDNDNHESARDIVANYESIIYCVQPLQGLSNARNKIVSLASGDFVLFIDDDEYAAPNWISRMMDCQMKYNADVVLGRVIYEIPSSFPKYIKDSVYFIKKLRLDGEAAKFNEGYTGNTLVKRELFLLRNPPFLTEFNFTGGEDSNFFNYLLAQNILIIFCNSAIIYEIQDEKRLKLTWFFNRGIIGGRNYVFTVYRDKSIISIIYTLLKSLIGGIILSLIYLILAIILPNKFLLVFVSKFGNQVGKLTFWINLKLKNY